MPHVKCTCQNPGKLQGQAVKRVTVLSAFISNPHLHSSYIITSGFLVDTGSKVTVVPRHYSKDVWPDKFIPLLVGANGSKIKTYGRCKIRPKILGKFYDFIAIVADVKTPILGMDFFGTAGKNILVDPANQTLKTRINAIAATDDSHDSIKNQAMKLFDEYPNLFNCSLGSVTSLTIPFRVETENNPPVFQKVRPLHGKKREEVENELKTWLNEGIIEPVHEEVQWASPIHAVPKEDSWRVCGDFRLLNAATKTDKYPLPNLSTFNSKMNGCKFFAKIDLKRAYHQIPIVQQDQIKTTINTTLGLF